MTSRTPEYQYVIDFIEKLNLNPEFVSFVHIDPEAIQVGLFVAQEGSRATGIAEFGKYPQTLTSVVKYPMRDYYMEEEN